MTIPASDRAGPPQKSARFDDSGWHLACLRPRSRGRRGRARVPPGGGPTKPCEQRFGNLMSDWLRLLGGCVFLALAALTARRRTQSPAVEAERRGHRGGPLAGHRCARNRHPLGRPRQAREARWIHGPRCRGAIRLADLPCSQMNQDLPAMLDTSFGTTERVTRTFRGRRAAAAARHEGPRLQCPVAPGPPRGARLQHRPTAKSSRSTSTSPATTTASRCRAYS